MERRVSNDVLCCSQTPISPSPILLHSSQSSPLEVRWLPCLKPFMVASIFFERNIKLLTVVPRPNFIRPSFPLFSFQFFIMPYSLPTLGSLFLEAPLPDPFPVILIKPRSGLSLNATSSGQPSPQAPGLHPLSCFHSTDQVCHQTILKYY